MTSHEVPGEVAPMTQMTCEQVVGERRARGWPDLTEADVDRVVDILNDALGALAGLDDVSWVEPAHRFRVERHD